MSSQGMDQEVFDAFINQLERYVRERLVPAEDELIQLNRVPDEIFGEMKEMGLFGMTIPEEFGGAGMNISQYMTTIKTLCWAHPAYRSIVSINTGMFATALKNQGTAAQRTEWFPRLASGEVGAFALTEPDSGSDSAGLKTRAVKNGKGYLLNGTKRYITNAPVADVVLVMARTNTENLPRNAHISSFIVPVNTLGVTIGSADKKMGQEGSLISDVILEDVQLPEEALLGCVEGQGFQAAMKSLNTGRLSVGMLSLGYAKRILDCGVRYALDRKAFGEPIANFQLIQAMLADSEMEIYAAECMLDDACRRADAGEDIIVKAAAAKMFASEMCCRVADRVVQIHGGAGYLKEYQAERFFRDSRIFRIYEGTTQILQLVIAKRMLREYGANL